MPFSLFGSKSNTLFKFVSHTVHSTVVKCIHKEQVTFCTNSYSYNYFRVPYFTDLEKFDTSTNEFGFMHLWETNMMGRFQRITHLITYAMNNKVLNTIFLILKTLLPISMGSYVEDLTMCENNKVLNTMYNYKRRRVKV